MDMADMKATFRRETCGQIQATTCGNEQLEGDSGEDEYEDTCVQHCVSGSWLAGRATRGLR